MQLEPRIESSSMALTIMFNGFMVDARKLHRDIQVVAYEKGLIPYVHADKQWKIIGLISRQRLIIKNNC